MLTTLLAWIYITFLCWVWGIFCLHLIKRLTKNEILLPHFSIICITGLASITVVAGMLSLIIPLGQWWVQVFFIAPCLLLFFKKSQYFFGLLKEQLLTLQIASVILLSICLLLILVMSTWTIVHPDTLGYHAQTIQWIEKYKVVPGLVHLHVRFGYQGLWFVDCALFGFSFTGKEGIIFLNSAVLLWFFIFIIDRINSNFFKDGKKLFGSFWIILLILSMWSYTQVRLTATSASPDFIATLFILTIIYLLLGKNTKHLSSFDWLLAGFLGVVAVTIKLSVAPILLVSFISVLFIFSKRQIKLSITTLLLFSITLFPFITRNIITSGYVVFPSTLIDIADVDWKYNKEQTTNEKNYITAYAKKPGVVTKDEIDSVNKMGPAQWIPEWWQDRSSADKTIITLMIISFFTALIFIRKIIRSGLIPILTLSTLITGIIFWFMNAPDPRFGFGSILGFFAVVAYIIFKEKEIFIGKNVLVSILLIIAGSISAYTGYRFVNFFSKEQLLTPLGIERSEFKTFVCDGIKINSPVADKEFGITPVPCTDFDCEKFSSRGKEINDGFKAK